MTLRVLITRELLLSDSSITVSHLYNRELCIFHDSVALLELGA